MILTQGLYKSYFLDWTEFIDKFLGFGFLRNSSFFVFFQESSSVLRISSNLESNLQAFFKDSWSNFGRALMLGEFMPNELQSASIYSGLSRKSPFKTNILEDKWSILIGQKSKSPIRTCWYLSPSLFILLEIIINYKLPDMIGRNTYLDFEGPSDMWQFLICRFDDTWHRLICSLIFNLITLVTYVNLRFVTKFDMAIYIWLSNFCFLQDLWGSTTSMEERVFGERERERERVCYEGRE